ncbi:hypothetical protein KC957_00975 [Candidatus Saccharibacteria bacterium]|nr:hypothetical protein [Candidatus Saccharibacteria bacterium]
MESLAVLMISAFFGLVILVIIVAILRWALRINEIVNGLTEIVQEVRYLRAELTAQSAQSQEVPPEPIAKR